MASVQLPTEWLDKAWGGSTKQDMNPVLCIDGSQLKITIFPKGGAGMRVVKRAIPETGHVTFTVTDAMRAYIRLLLEFPDITLHITQTELSIIAQNCCSAIQYNFPKIETVEDNVIPDHPKDVHVHVSTTHWLNMWKSMPSKGVIHITTAKHTRAVTMKHSRGRWAGAIQARDKPPHSCAFKGDSGVARRIFSYAVVSSSFSELVFMDCGVLKWIDGDTTIYLAPVE